jgi:hypothetical protein
VQPLLDAAPDIASWNADTSGPQTVLTVESDTITAERVSQLLAPAGYRVLNEESSLLSLGVPPKQPAPQPAKRATYFPLLLILGYLLAGVAVIEAASGQFQAMRAMSHFMAGFFLVFSFFKLLDIQAFADAYTSYDIVAAKWRTYGLLYPFIELSLGIAYLGHFAPVTVNAITLIVMSVSAVGVVRTLLAKRTIRCACLGTVFNLPMSRITLIEDGLMIAMAAGMLLLMM